jgi:hypothetical protein
MMLPGLTNGEMTHDRTSGQVRICCFSCFAGMDCPRVRYPQFNDEVEAELAAAGYQVLTGPSEQVDKVVQLYEVMMTRHTTMVVGQTGAMQSSCCSAGKHYDLAISLACLAATSEQSTLSRVGQQFHAHVHWHL